MMNEQLKRDAMVMTAQATLGCIGLLLIWGLIFYLFADSAVDALALFFLVLVMNRLARKVLVLVGTVEKTLEKSDKHEQGGVG